MKYVIVIPDGCADEPQESLGGRTPLEAACTPNMDAIAKLGIVGRANHTPKHLPAGSAVANMSLLGYDPNENFTGRAPLEAAAQGIEISENDWVVRCNLVNVTDQIMRSFTAEHISSGEAKQLLDVAQEKMTDDRFEFVPGVSYRNLLLYRPHENEVAPFSMETRTTPPHDLTDKTVAEDFPRGPGSDALNRIMGDSLDWFADHAVNAGRVSSGKLPATNVWLWGLGQRPKLASFKELHGIQGAMITAVDLLRGLASLIGWDRIEVPGATGYVDTDYAAKGRYGIDALQKYDIVCVHVEASDEASHEGDVAKKIAAIESVDADVVGPILKHLQSSDEPWRMIVTPDHPTYCSTKTHTHGDVPFSMAGAQVEADATDAYHEKNAAASDVAYDAGSQLMNFFLKAD